MIAITLIAWSLHHWNGKIKAEKFAQANQLKHQTDLLIATGHFDQAQASLQDLESFVAGSPWPQMRQMAADERQELAARRLQQMEALARAHANPPTSTAPTSSPPHSSPPPAAVASSVSPATSTPVEAYPPEPRSVATNTRTDDGLKATEGPYATNATPNRVVTIRTTPPRPPVRQITQLVKGPTDETIGATITRGIDILLARFDPHTYLLPGARIVKGSRWARTSWPSTHHAMPAGNQ